MGRRGKRNVPKSKTTDQQTLTLKNGDGISKKDRKERVSANVSNSECKKREVVLTDHSKEPASSATRRKSGVASSQAQAGQDRTGRSVIQSVKEEVSEPVIVLEETVSHDHSQLTLVEDSPDNTSNRKRKLVPEEKVLLSQLYYDHFTVYHNKRYGDDYIDGEINLKQWLLSDWAKQLASLNISESSNSEGSCTTKLGYDIPTRINEMIIDVSEFRRNPRASYNLQMSPSFTLVNKVYDFIDVSHPEIEKLLDDYEKAYYRRYDRKLIEKYNNLKNRSWTVKEKSLLLECYKLCTTYFNTLPCRKKANESRQYLLHMWCQTISELGGAKRSMEEVEAKIAYYILYDVEGPVDVDKKASTRKSKPNTRRSSSPTAVAFRAISGTPPVIDETFDLDKLFLQIKQVQKNIIQKAKPYWEQGNKGGNNGTTPEDDGKLPKYLSSHRGRPHMTRVEKYLLGLLYRQNHEEYDRSTHRKRTSVEKAALLSDWAEKLTYLGVTKREPEEIRHKVTTSRSLVRNYKEALVRGVMDPRPLSPTTRLFDLEDSEIIDETAYTEDAIRDYIEEARSSFQYPSSKRTTDISKESTAFSTEPTRANIFENSCSTVIASISKPNDQPPKAVDMVETVQIIKKETHDLPNDRIVNSDLDIDPQLLTLADVLRYSISQSPNDINFYGSTFGTVKTDLLNMNNTTNSVVVYDTADRSGHMTRIAITRSENGRDINYHLWTKSLDIETDEILTMYVCFMCDQMAHSPTKTSALPSRRYQGLTAQQSSPSLVLSSSSNIINLSWVQGTPKHNCVPFLLSTICDKIAQFSHKLIRIYPSKV